MSRRVGHRLLWIPSMIAFFAMIVVFSRQPRAAPSPGSFTEYTSHDKYLVMNIPSDWKAGGMSMQGTSTEVAMTPARHVYFWLKADIAGSMMADIAKSGNTQMENLAGGINSGSVDVESGSAGDSGGSDESDSEGLAGAVRRMAKPPVQTLHEADGAEYVEAKDSFLNYQEGATTKPTIGGMECRRTEFTYERNTMFGKREMRGARYTLLNTDRRIRMMYRYPKEFEGVMEPVMKKIASSLRVGQGE